MNKQEPESKVSNLPNTFQHPNWHVDQLMHLLTSDEFKVLSFIVRHTLGWQTERISRQRNISLTMFQGGFVTSESIHYGGTGLSHSSITQSLKNLVSFGLILQVEKDQVKGTLWELPASARIKWDLLRKRQADKEQDSIRRTNKARAASLAKRSVGQNTKNVVNLFCGTEEQPSVGHKESNPLSNPDSKDADASLQTSAKTKRQVLDFPVKGLTEKLLADEQSKERERDLLFESVLLYGHGITYVSGMKVPDRTAGWVRGVVKELKLGGVDPQEFVKFCKGYKTWSGGLAFPRDAVKLLASYNQWNSEQPTNAKQAAGDWTPLHAAYQAATAAPDSERAKILNMPLAKLESAVLMEDDFGNAALAPFESVLAALKGKVE